jgi:hypothetical protein
VVKKIAENRGLPLHVYSGEWKGFGTKLITGQKASRELTQYTHLMLMDAFDVITMASAGDILSRFMEFGHPFVCQAELNCWPNPEKAPRFPKCDTIWKYLNSGLYVVERKYLGDLWNKHGPISPAVYDQEWVTDVFLNDPGCIQLDTGCKLFQSLHGSQACVEMKNGKLFNKITGTYPLIAHHHGGADIRDEFARKFWQ